MWFRDNDDVQRASRSGPGDWYCALSPLTHVSVTRIPYRQWTASLTECLREAQAQGELPAGKDPGQVAVALIDAFEGAVTRAKVERNRSPFDSFEGFALPALVT